MTQACARNIHAQVDEASEPRFAGIRYLSHLGAGQAYECWAIFADRMKHAGETVQASIPPDDPALLDAARSLSLTIETAKGRYLRP